MCNDDQYGQHQGEYIFSPQEIFLDDPSDVPYKLTNLMQHRVLGYKHVPPGKMFPVVTILQVALHSVRLAFKVHVAIGFHTVATLGVPPQPFYAVPKRKPQKQHLALLQGVDVFVIFIYFTQSSLVASAKDDSKDIRGKKTAEWDVFIIDYFHWWAKIRLFTAQDGVGTGTAAVAVVGGGEGEIGIEDVGDGLL